VPTPGDLIREARERHGLSQARLARRANTTQRQVSRIERGEISPSISTLDRLLAAMGERLELVAHPGPRGNTSTRELRADLELTASERLAQVNELSHSLTSLAAKARGR